MQYPEYHQQIVEALFLEGRFLLEGEAAFNSLIQHKDFYADFFRLSFGLQLHQQSEYAVLESERENDTHSRDVCIFLAVLSYELDREGSNVLEALRFHTFSYEQVEQMLELSSFREVLEASKALRDGQSRKNFYHMLARKGLIEKLNEQQFRFSPAHRYFLDFARGIALERLQEATSEE